MSQLWNTETEIAAQPEIWDEWSRALPDIAASIREWVFTRKPTEIWLCGAGSSAFIGDTLAVSLNGRISDIPVRAISSTDLVARPYDYLKGGVRPLVVSFGRSGNSSESVGTLDILDRECPTADRLHITCNKDSVLATRPINGSGEQKVIVLPDACHDKGFAMTSSYTTMLLSALACLDNGPLDEIENKVAQLAQSARSFLATRFAHPVTNRVVFLGSGPFLGTARESALKMLELTAGKVVTSWDSTLGFRHGPKAIVNDLTSVFIYLSSDPLTRKYDQDIVDEIRSQFPDTTVLSIGDQCAGRPDADITMPTGLPDVWNALLYVLFAQRLSVAWAKELDINVDNPFEGGNLTRVVSGVKLYE